jgi:hypothetical protein
MITTPTQKVFSSKPSHWFTVVEQLDRFDVDVVEKHFVMLLRKPSNFIRNHLHLKVPTEVGVSDIPRCINSVLRYFVLIYRDVVAICFLKHGGNESYGGEDDKLNIATLREGLRSHPGAIQDSRCVPVSRYSLFPSSHNDKHQRAQSAVASQGYTMIGTTNIRVNNSYRGREHRESRKQLEGG